MKSNYLKLMALALCMVPFSCQEPEEEVTGGENASITVNPTSYTAEDYTQQTFVVEVTADCKWNVTSATANGSKAEWIQTDTQSGDGNGSFNVRLLENETADSRTADIVVTSENGATTVEIPVTQPGNPDSEVVPPTVEGYSFPITEMWDTGLGVDVPSGSVTLVDGLANADISGNTITFNKGLVIEKSVETDFAIACPAHTNPKVNAGFQTAILAYNWTTEDYWLLKIPVKEDLYGDLRFCYGSRKDKGFTITWSSDEGVTWNNFTGEITAAPSEAMWKSVAFSIPEAQKVAAGKYLWIKMVALASNEDYNMLSNGIAILPAEAEKSELPAQDNSSVVVSEGFDDLVAANAMYIDIPVGFMKSWVGLNPANGNFYVPVNPALEVERCYSKPGFLQISYADEALKARYLESNNYGRGKLMIKVGDRLKEMGKTTADLTVKFKCAGITTAFNEPVNTIVTLQASSGTVENGTIANADLSMDAFKEYTMTVKGADQSTVLTLTSADAETFSSNEDNSPDYRFFVDDILITIAE